MRSRFLALAITALLLASCSSRQAVSNLQSSVPHPGGVGSLVRQTGAAPVQWRQFYWGVNNNPYYSTIVTGPDNNIWYTNYSGADIIRMLPTGATTFFPLSVSSVNYNPTSMAVGSDGKFYVGAPGATSVGVVTTTGSFTTHGLLSGSGHNMSYTGMALGPDGNVWFTEYGFIGKITTGGTITDYAYSDSNTANYYGGVTTGPDGNVWVTEYNDQQIDKVIPGTGAQTKYALGCTPYSVVSAAGDLYVNCNNEVAQVTTAGVVTLFSTGFNLGTSGLSIAKGPDGNPWFLANSGTAGYPIAEFNPTNGSITYYYPPSNYNADYALTKGPDGNMWAVGSSNGDGAIDVYILGPNVISVSPASLTFTGTSQTQNVTVTESGVTSWTGKSEDTAIATVTQGSPADTFAVKSVTIGNTKAVFMDANGNSFAVPVTVK
jgi:streptogramin lyase